MNLVAVGIGQCEASKDQETALITYALGSCIGLAVFDPAARAGGLLHVLLPDASLDPAKAARQPCLFADTGLTVLLDRCVQLGAAKSRSKVWIAGGSAVLDTAGVFNIGKRNQLSMRKALWKAGLMTHGEDVGGAHSRTVRLDLAGGTFWVRPGGAPEQELKGPVRSR
jgi:chemotaxis protein CheD